MAGSLQDQLVKMGVANEKQAKGAKKQKHIKAQKGRKIVTETPESQLVAQQKKETKAKKDRELNQQKEQQKKKKAIQAQVKQLIESNAVEIPEGSEVSYHFTHNKKVKKLFVNSTLQTQLVQGKISIAVLGNRYQLVPATIAARIAERDPQAIIVNVEEASNTEDEYADYQIPDDLQW